MSGPNFIMLYIAAIIAGIGISVGVRRTFWHAAESASPHQPHPPLTVDELAFMVGGVNRMIDVSIARMVESGVLRVSRDGNLHATGALGATQLDNEILRHVRELPNRRVPTRAPQLREMARFFALNHVQAALRDRGLLYVETAGQKLLVVLPLLAVLALGAIRLITAAPGRPVGFLIALIVFTSLATLIRLMVADKYSLTHSGADLLERVKRAGAAQASRWLPVTVAAGAAGLVLFSGLEAFPDPEVAAVLGPSPRGGDGGGSGSSGGDGGGSDGGGGGCGGGCGGCGGGGD